MQLNVNEFKAVIKQVEIGLLPPTFVPILSHICFTPDTVFIYNGVEAISVKYTTGLHCAIPGEVLCKLIKSITAETLEITQTDVNVLIRLGKATTKLALLPATDFIYTPTTDISGQKITVTSDFILGIKKCLATVNKDPGKINQHGISLYNNCLYSTDMHRIARYKLKDEITIQDKIFLPIKFCSIISSVFSSECDLYISEKNISCVSQQITVYSEKVLGITFLDFEKMLSICKVADTHFQYVPITMPSILDRCQIFVAGQNEKIIGITVGNKFLEFDANGKYGDHVEDCVSESVDNIGRFRVDVTYLSELISNVKQIGFTKLPKIVIISGNDGNYLQLLSSLYLS